MFFVLQAFTTHEADILAIVVNKVRKTNIVANVSASKVRLYSRASFEVNYWSRDVVGCGQNFGCVQGVWPSQILASLREGVLQGRPHPYLPLSRPQNLAVGTTETLTG